MRHTGGGSNLAQYAANECRTLHKHEMAERIWIMGPQRLGCRLPQSCPTCLWHHCNVSIKDTQRNDQLFPLATDSVCVRSVRANCLTH